MKRDEYANEICGSCYVRRSVCFCVKDVCVCVQECVCLCEEMWYGVATISRLLKMSLLQNIVSFVGLFCERNL